MARKGYMLESALHELSFLFHCEGTPHWAETHFCLILCSSQWLSRHVKIPLWFCVFFLVGKQSRSQARVELGFLLACSWLVTEVRLDHSGSVDFSFAQYWSQTISFEPDCFLLSFEKSNARFPKSMGISFVACVSLWSSCCSQLFS